MVLEIFNKTRQKMGFDSLLKPSQNKKGRNFSSCTKNGVFFSGASSKKKTPFLVMQLENLSVLLIS
jgi:hypothetical protein